MNHHLGYLAPVAAAIVLIALSVVPESIWTNRFVPREITEEQKELARRLEKLPTKFDDWVGKETPMSETERKAAAIVGDYSYQFHNKNSPNQIISVMIACGHGADMHGHRPDQCFVASGFTAVDAQQEYPIDVPPSPAKFFTCRFRRDLPGQGPQNLRIFWSFSTGTEGQWLAPTTRMEVSTEPAIYKIYATTYLPSDTREMPSESPAVPFLKEFLPIVNKTLFPPEDDKSKAAADGAASVDSTQAQTPETSTTK